MIIAFFLLLGLTLKSWNCAFFFVRSFFHSSFTTITTTMINGFLILSRWIEFVYSFIFPHFSPFSASRQRERLKKTYQNSPFCSDVCVVVVVVNVPFKSMISCFFLACLLLMAYSLAFLWKSELEKMIKENHSRNDFLLNAFRGMLCFEKKFAGMFWFFFKELQYNLNYVYAFILNKQKYGKACVLD